LTVTDLSPPASVALPLTFRVFLLVAAPLARAETVRVGGVASAVVVVTVTVALLAAETLPAASLAQA